MIDFLSDLLKSVYFLGTRRSFKKLVLGSLTEFRCFNEKCLIWSEKVFSKVWMRREGFHQISRWILGRWVCFIHKFRAPDLYPFRLFVLEVILSLIQLGLHIYYIFPFVTISVKDFGKIIFAWIDKVIDTNLGVWIWFWCASRSRVCFWLKLFSGTQIWNGGALFSWQRFFNKFFSFQWSLFELFSSFLNVTQKRFDISSFEISIFSLRYFDLFL